MKLMNVVFKVELIVDAEDEQDAIGKAHVLVTKVLAKSDFWLTTVVGSGEVVSIVNE